MRGVVSLATAMALPLETPDRDLLLFLTFCVILVTLVGQGLSLPLYPSGDLLAGALPRPRARRAFLYGPRRITLGTTEAAPIVG
jgi:NhaP-type Na+/H+ or K+/H+ antiporter